MPEDLLGNSTQEEVPSKDKIEDYKLKMFHDVTAHSKPMLITNIFVRRYFMISILMLMFFTVVTIVTINNNLLNMVNPIFRDFFISDDIRTQRLDVESSANSLIWKELQKFYNNGF